MPEFTGYLRPDGRAGARDHLLVLPSVVCAAHVAVQAAGDFPAVVHQHGCLHVGDDLAHTADSFVGLATNPNVRAVVVVSLGCETVQGRLVSEAIAARGQTVELVEIQAAGGSEPATERVREVIAELDAATATDRADAVDAPVVGIDQVGTPLVAEIARALTDAGMTPLLPDRAPGPPSHVELAGRGAQVIVSLCGAHEAPLGSPVCPVIAVALDPQMRAALGADFDLDGTEAEASVTARAVAERAVAVYNGALTSAELRGAHDLVLERLAVTM